MPCMTYTVLSVFCFRYIFSVRWFYSLFAMWYTFILSYVSGFVVGYNGREDLWKAGDKAVFISTCHWRTPDWKAFFSQWPAWAVQLQTRSTRWSKSNWTTNAKAAKSMHLGFILQVLLQFTLSLSLSFPFRGAAHRPNPLQELPEALWVHVE